jgi:hypothetical protein
MKAVEMTAFEKGWWREVAITLLWSRTSAWPRLSSAEYWRIDMIGLMELEPV